MSSGWFDWTEPSLRTALQGKEGVQGARSTGSGRFKHIEPHRTFASYIHTELARSIEFFYTSSAWFDWTEPSPTTSLQGIPGVQGARGTNPGRFKYLEPHGTFSSDLVTELARYLALFETSSGWFDCTEPSSTSAKSTLTPSIPCIAEKVRFSRTTPNACKGRLYTLLSLWRCLSRRFDEVRSG